MKSLDHSHPRDDRLIAVYFGDEQGDADERRAVRQHLHGCETCTWRYTELTAPLERLRRDAASEADEVFTPSRLAAQREAVMRRLEQGGSAGRVLPFPSGAAGLTRSLGRRPMTRWIAAAAAAGLLFGILAGRVIEYGRPVAPAVAKASAMHAPVVSSGAPVTVADLNGQTPADEAFLTDFDQAVTRQRIPALSALDACTPHVREVALLASR